MKRSIYNELLLWKNNKNRKPLLIQGARQVGKTYLINDFGKNEYDKYIYLNFEQTPDLKLLFAGNLIPKDIIHNIGLYLGKKVNAINTLIFFDEIQAIPEALTSLKYFHEQAPEFHIIAAGSLLGVSVGKERSFPVGKVNFLNLYPMSFSEYLIANNEKLLVESLQNMIKTQALSEIIHNKLVTHLKTYLFLGGMPEVLQNYLDNKNIAIARKIQIEILEAYKRDFSKYTDKNQTIKTIEIWNSIPYQLAKENKKFKYADVRKNARASTFQQSITWLKNAGLINVAYNISTPKLPLAGYSNSTKFKIFMLDTGLLGALLNISSDIIIKPNQLFLEYNGAFIENFVASELIASGHTDLFYWTSKSDAEVDFVLQLQNSIYPLEVKSGKSKNLKSIRSYAKKYKPKQIIRISPRNFIQNNEFINIPLYAIFILDQIVYKTE